VVELSNEGLILMDNPCRPNPKGESVSCRFPGCTNTTENFDALCTNHKGEKVPRLHLVDWIGRLIPPGVARERCKNFAPEHAASLELLVKWMKEPPAGSEERRRREEKMDGFVDALLDALVGKIPDATSLQEDWEMDGEGKGKMVGEVVEIIKSLVDDWFPKGEFRETILQGKVFRKRIPIQPQPNQTQASLAPGEGTVEPEKNPKFTYDKIPVLNVPIRKVAAILLVGLACEESNRGDLWFASRNGGPTSRASVYMPIAYYLLRRHTKANEKQARMSLKTRVSD
jgi:hypothetical protein